MTPKGDPDDKWKNRRSMAWVSFYMLCGITVGVCVRLFYFGDDPNSWTAIAGMTIGSLAGIVLGYTGAATYDQVKQREEK